MLKFYAFLLALSSFVACKDSGIKQDQWNDLSDGFKNYWYAGKAEIASYDLKQARYGEVHKGNAVLIFVTEDFSRSKQVKLDYPEEAGEDQVKVMKLNFTKKFNTGIYPYSIMMSVFSPVYEDAAPLKLSMSSQEWCGHVFTQMNYEEGRYQVEQYSYFESEGDKDYMVRALFTEDEIWNRIRIDYKSLPQGEVTVIPGLIFSRLLHQELLPVTAVANLETFGDTLIYQLDYEDEHKLRIEFSQRFPHTIYGWTETFKGIDGSRLTTTAELMDTLIIDYWNKNRKDFLYLRDSLNLK